MPAPNLTSADYLRAFQALMPRGRVWPTDSDAEQTQVLAGLTKIYARNTERANQLLVDAFPGTTYELLPEWEATLGLPDPCAGPTPTIQQRRNQVIARLSNSGGQSIAYFINFAAQLGYTVTIKQYTQARAGMLRAGDPCCGYDWNFAWKITAPLNTIVRAVAGAMAAGDPLAAWGNNVLECEFRAVMPAHTIPIFAYA
ncbi:YmfQ family protein [Burkholderia stagnalis]|uniref:YmfQ family protein n=1 Tax=Burkholderia stagnalis TaxID=1503054 RepID=UPI00076D9C34|nr:putative phage tail protein [Burkholderia stagnalis]KWN77054.1 phage tail protein [Burkholderia stagnalis]